MKQGSGAATGFFEQGLMVGGAVALTGLVGGLGILGRYVVVPVMRKRFGGH